MLLSEQLRASGDCVHSRQLLAILVVAQGWIIVKLRVHQRLNWASTAASLQAPPSLCVVALRLHTTWNIGKILVGSRCIASNVITIVIIIVIVIQL